MTQASQLAEVEAEFESVDGISATPDNSVSLEDDIPDNRILVKVHKEGAIGQFFRICRENDVERTATSRNDLSYTVMDSWIHIKE